MIAPNNTEHTDFIEVYPDAISPEVCQQLIQQFNHSKLTQPGRTGGGVDTSKKLSQDIYLQSDAVFQSSLPAVFKACNENIGAYLSKYFFSIISGISLNVAHPVTKQPVQLTADNFEEVGKPNINNLMQYLFRMAPVNMQMYQKNKGNYGYWHSEIYPQTGANDALHRVLLFLIYLNDIEEGGETDFFYQSKSIRPKAGSMVIAPCGFTHTHRGNVPISDDKYVLTSWVLFNQAKDIYTNA